MKPKFKPGDRVIVTETLELCGNDSDRTFPIGSGFTVKSCEVIGIRQDLQLYGLNGWSLPGQTGFVLEAVYNSKLYRLLNDELE